MRTDQLTMHKQYASLSPLLDLKPKLCQTYRNVPKFSDRQVWANSADPDQTALEESSDQGLHCLPFRLPSWPINIW